jgi:hypothetical protein
MVKMPKLQRIGLKLEDFIKRTYESDEMFTTISGVK